MNTAARRRMIVGLAAVLGSLGGVRAQTVHVLLVADTRDPLLQRACARDVETMHGQAAQIAAALGYRLAEQRLVDADFTRKKLDAALRSLAPQPDDVLFFYYSGHGYNLRDRADRFPILALEKTGANAAKNPGLGTIHQLLKAKKARMCVTLGDCCNNLVTLTRGMVRKKPAPPGLTDSLDAAYRKLFLQTRGDVLIASSAPPQQACAHPDSGSFYTRAFDEALSALRRPDASWPRLLRDAQTRLNRHAATRAKQSLYAVNVVTEAPAEPLAGTEPGGFTPTAAVASVNMSPLSEALLPEVPSVRVDAVVKSPAALRVELRTNRGRENVVFAEGDTVVISVKATRPCHLRLLYRLADGTMTVLDDGDVEIKPGQEGAFVRLAPQTPFVCAEPFGEETLVVFASETPFCPLPTGPNAGAYVRVEGGYRLFVGSLPEILKVARCAETGEAVAEDRIDLTTRAVAK
jgi:hypothetical protein